MKKFLRYQDGYTNFDPITNEVPAMFDTFRGRYLSLFTPRAPTPPKSKEGSPKASCQFTTWRYRQPSLDSADVFVLKIPFSSVNYINNMSQLQNLKGAKHKKHIKGRKSYVNNKHRRSISMDID
ncbi:hypothetical protein SteCoe_19733 [Stentor coeruleus]|uniref:Uncharacterized protein n=1 Tax=Stentor coeruleus TaxID=5963 RepID=A0A1R2BTL0_9CILI|nr:hypothetical protein SteCoe_19733 [Stentor coeruleus]